MLKCFGSNGGRFLSLAKCEIKTSNYSIVLLLDNSSFLITINKVCLLYCEFLGCNANFPSHLSEYHLILFTWDRMCATT